MKESVRMSDQVTSITQIQATPQAAEVRAGATKPRSQPVPVDTVQLSSSAQAALREAVETPAQTAKEANTGDLQARKLLAKQEAAREASATDEAANTKHVVA
jgi:hypothetical protein